MLIDNVIATGFHIYCQNAYQSVFKEYNLRVSSTTAKFCVQLISQALPLMSTESTSMIGRPPRHHGYKNKLGFSIAKHLQFWLGSGNKMT